MSSTAAPLPRDASQRRQPGPEVGLAGDPRRHEFLAPVVTLTARRHRVASHVPPGSSEDRRSGPPPPSREFTSMLVVRAIEVLDGTRTVSQLRGFITGEVAERLAMHRNIRAERRAVYRDERRRVPTPGSVHLSFPREDVAEAAVTVYLGGQAVATALRLEHLRGRWRATSLTVLQ